MPCVNIGDGIICINPWGRLHVGNRYVYVDFHEYCGPSFSYDPGGQKLYDPVDENDPVWDEFSKWYDKYKQQKAKNDAKRAARSVP